MWGILLMTCGEFERDRWLLVVEMSRIVGAGEWLEEYGSVCKDDKVHCCWEKVWRE